MQERREVDRYSTIFDLKIGKALSLPKSVSTRVMFTYDKNNMKREFKILDNRMNADISNRIKSWLIKNVESYDDICDLYAIEMDADHFAKAMNY